MKYFILLLLLILVSIISCSPKKKDNFNLKVKVNGDYLGYLFLDYNNYKDSSLIKNGECEFLGKVNYPTEASFHTSSISTNNEIFYLENENINIDIFIEKKNIGEYNVDMININKVTGTGTSLIKVDFENFKEKHKANLDWNEKLYNKLKQLIEENPRNRYIGELFSDISYDSILKRKQLISLYDIVDLEYQDPFRIKRIKYNIFPENRMLVGKNISDFKLQSANKDEMISTIGFRGSVLLIDFWASWCGPCRKEFPELLNIASQFKNKNFNVLGVSLDKNKNKWLKTIQDDNLLWDNVIDTTSLNGKIATDYGVFGIPSNFLVNEKGVVLAKNLSPKELKIKLNEIYQ